MLAGISSHAVLYRAQTSGDGMGWDGMSWGCGECLGMRYNAYNALDRDDTVEREGGGGAGGSWREWGGDR